MGGPWKDRGFDPRTWSPPAPRAEARSQPVGSGSARDDLIAFVIGYVACVLTLIPILLALFRNGW
ncbi:MAG TPA: hypothetical protein VGW35_13555 [Methylomirabilota bacterium]|jgi:hypothetical protein|nr:hypothetical protein [Methylomirabilota bacterium]